MPTIFVTTSIVAGHGPARGFSVDIDFSDSAIGCERIHDLEPVRHKQVREQSSRNLNNVLFLRSLGTWRGITYPLKSKKCDGETHHQGKDDAGDTMIHFAINMTEPQSMPRILCVCKLSFHSGFRRQ